MFFIFLGFSDIFKRSKLCCNCFHHPSTDDCKNTVKVKTNFYFTEFFLCKNVLRCTASASTYPNMPMLLMIVLLGKEAIGFCSGICLCINLVSEKNTKIHLLRWMELHIFQGTRKGVSLTYVYYHGMKIVFNLGILVDNLPIKTHVIWGL